VSGVRSPEWGRGKSEERECGIGQEPDGGKSGRQDSGVEGSADSEREEDLVVSSRNGAARDGRPYRGEL